MTAIFRTVVIDLPPTPLGLLSDRWTIEHWCTLCRHQVATEDLVTHAQAHSGDAKATNGTEHDEDA
jgi:hypothetical protein